MVQNLGSKICFILLRFLRGTTGHQLPLMPHWRIKTKMYERHKASQCTNTNLIEITLHNLLFYFKHFHLNMNVHFFQ